MKKLLLITGDIAAGKSTFSKLLSARYGAAAFQKDAVKEVLSDRIGFHTREENKTLSYAAVDMMCHIFSQTAPTGADMILEANFHTHELEALHSAAGNSRYDVLTILLRGDPDVLHQRYLHRMNHENRHPAHLAAALHEKDAFIKAAEFIRSERVPGKTLAVDATDFSYQDDPAILSPIDAFMKE